MDMKLKNVVLGIINKKPNMVKCAYIRKNIDGFTKFNKLKVGYSIDEYEKLLLFLDDFDYKECNTIVGSIWFSNNACININIYHGVNIIEYKEIPEIPTFLFYK